MIRMSVDTAPLLVELLVEELPPKALKKLGDAFGQGLLLQLQNLGLADATSQLTTFATPRRLGTRITDIASKAADRSVEQKLMPVAIGLGTDNLPTPALTKKLLALGVSESEMPNAVANLKRSVDGKAEHLIYQATLPGAQLHEGLQRALTETIAKLPIPKVMTYQLMDGWTDAKFVRPAHSLIALHGETIVPITALGLTADRTTQGHRFESKSQHIVIRSADSYEQQLKDEGKVIACYATRQKLISEQLGASAQTASSRAGYPLKPIEDAELLDEVTSLVEYPNVLTCQFEPEFLTVPQECLILTMKANQKYFPLLNSEGRLVHQFLVVSNINPADASAVIKGNERVVRPRLADAKFFFEQDAKKSLASHATALHEVIYHNQLGTQADRLKRVHQIAQSISQQLHASSWASSAPTSDFIESLASEVSEAAQLAKADLLTGMVGEFPELQGIMGGYYARLEGLRDGVALAIEDHYKPRFAGDALPRHPTGMVLALADKLETLAGMFAIGNLPTGDKDPYALRRHALGVIRILIEKNLPLELPELLQNAFSCLEDRLQANKDGASQALLTFFYERLASSLREQNYTAQEIESVLALRPPYLGDIPKRLAAVRSFSSMPESASLASANKRVGNILKKADSASIAAINEALLAQGAEMNLYTELQRVQPLSDQAYKQGNYTDSLQKLAQLKAPIDAFFEHVMVNSDDAAQRANRLGLLATLHTAMNRVADLAKLAR